MMIETQEIIHRDLNFLPLKSYSNIVEGNALKIDWESIFKGKGKWEMGKEKNISPLSHLPSPLYIIGNPPFVGKTYQTAAQKADLAAVDKRLKPLDYVCGWYFKACNFMRNNSARAAFVSTNSVTQGEQVGYFWRMLDCHIDFAYRTFTWDSESTDKAHVHCVVIGFSCADYPKPKKIFTDKNNYEIAQNINGYLINMPNVYVEKRAAPLFEDVPIMINGSTPVDNGNFLFTRAEMEDFIKKEPLAKKFIRQYVGADEFINGKLRYCLWLVDATPAELRKMKLVMERVKNVREFRLQSKKAATRKKSDMPTLFAEIRNVDEVSLFIPMLSSSNRRYIPIGFIDSDVIVSNLASFIPKTDLYHFGVLTSSIMMAWIKVVGGRLKSDYRYSATIVYNNFIWCEPTPSQKEAIEATAQEILDVRSKYPDSTLADLYDELTMPSDLRRAHRKNDIAVAKAYGMEEILDDEAVIVRELFRRYELLTKS